METKIKKTLSNQSKHKQKEKFSKCHNIQLLIAFRAILA